MSKLLELAKKNIYNRAHIYLFALCILFECLAFAFSRIIISDFHPINGDFQNFNPMRRLLSGQVPFVDFPPYLGLGVLALNILPLAIGGGSFTASLFVTNFTAVLCCIIITFVIVFLSTGDKRLAMLASVLMPLFLRFGYRLNLPFSSFAEIASTGNSMRIERAVLPFFLSAILLSVLKLKRLDIFSLPQSKFAVPVAGFISGFFALWSNDYGFASIAACALTLLILFI